MCGCSLPNLVWRGLAMHVRWWAAPTFAGERRSSRAIGQACILLKVSTSPRRKHSLTASWGFIRTLFSVRWLTPEF